MGNKKDIEVGVNNRKALNTLLKPFCYFAKDADFVEVTEWSNGEGFDVSFSCRGENKTIMLTWGEFDALKFLVKKLDK